ncbi:hypothetical protein [Spirosoma panaciterrae]|uniref:hypothetical protein n=1 Tax=Spirosoma panaciterrae TaxID=496058 RepID=UPI0003609794|nr:hypothetical protein [Spirosoma panaciterrae]
MSLKEQVSSQLNQLSEAELAKVSQYIIELKGQLPPRRVKNDAYLDVRKAFKDVSGSMSQFIIDEREDRL